jgi:hypothetical protein
MNFCRRTFNLYFASAAILLSLASGCAFLKSEFRTDPRAILRIHIESGASSGSSQTVSVIRSQPVLVDILSEPIISEANVVSARLLDTAGGFAIEVKFNQSGGWALEQFTAANPGKHLIIFGQWSDKTDDGRWLGAPQISRRLANAALVFTPDASRAEAEQLVNGLNEDAKKRAK